MIKVKKMPTDVFWLHTDIFTELFHAFWTNNIVLLISCIHIHQLSSQKNSTLTEELYAKKQSLEK